MEILEQIMPLAWWGILVVAVIALIPYIILIFQAKKIKRFEKAHLSLKTLLSGKSIDDLLEQYLEAVEKIGVENANSRDRISKIESKLREAVDSFELVRFNAFENMGSDLSFALAMVNQEGNGVVISSINSREESRVYAKPLREGKSSYHLSEEEINAITKALEAKKV